MRSLVVSARRHLVALRHTMIPTLARRARMRWDGARNQYVLLYPEGVITLTEQAAEVLELVDGQRPLDDIVDTLAERYRDVVREEIHRDVLELFGRLSARGFVTEVSK
jgi:pyrroloquinoline quinone biosynthesis protein D